MNYSKEQVTLMKRYAKQLRLNLIDYNRECLISIFRIIDIFFTEIKNSVDADVDIYFNYNTRITSYENLNDESMIVNAKCYIDNLSKQISYYEKFYGYVDYCFSDRANKLFSSNNKNLSSVLINYQSHNPLINSRHFTVADLISVIRNVIEIGSLLSNNQIPHQDEALLALGGVEKLLKMQAGNLSNKDKIEYGLDLMFYIAGKITDDANIKRKLTVSSLALNSAIDFLVND